MIYVCYMYKHYMECAKRIQQSEKKTRKQGSENNSSLCSFSDNTSHRRRN